MRNFAENEKALFQRGIKGNCFISNNYSQSSLEGKDLRGCAPTAQILAGLLTDNKSGFYSVFEKMLVDLNSMKDKSLDSFIRTLLVQPIMQSRRGVATSLIYSCAVVGISFQDKTKKYGEQFSHRFTISQYGPKDGKCTYRLWQAYSRGVDKLIYSLNDWFNLSIEIAGVDPILREEMSSDVFKKNFLTPFADMISNNKNTSSIWLSLFGFDTLPKCDAVLLYFIVGNAYRYRPHFIAQKVNK